MFIATSWCLLVLVVTSRAESWRWPEGAQSVRIDTKVRFLDTGNDNKNRDKNIQSDEPPFEQPSDTDGFYNRPPGAGRYPMRIEPHLESYRVDSSSVYPNSNQGRRQYYDSDGTLDSLQYCKCMATDNCNPRADSHQVCGSGKSLCCYKRPNKGYGQKSEVFNELEDERPMLFPGQVHSDGAFSHPGDIGEYGHFGPNRQQVLVGPGGPTGQVGPSHAHQLITPEGPDDRIGPNGNIGPKGAIYHQRNPAVLVGPDGPTGIIGPGPVNINPRPDAGQSESAQRGVLVGPGGPTGFIGPYSQRPVLTGPSGPTGIIGPRGGRRGVLSGPGGPTGIIGPGYGRQSGPGVLIGPGGPTGVIGPGRQLLVGPGGPTGIIGPRYFESAPIKLKPKSQCKRNERNPQKNPLGKDADHEVLDEHTNPNTRVHHLGPPRAKRSFKITRVIQVRTVNSKREPLVTRDVRVVPLRPKRELFSSVNGTNKAALRSIRELLSSITWINERVPQTKRELFSTGRGKNDLATWSKRKWFCTFNDAPQSKRDLFSTGRGTNEGVSMSKGEHSSNGQRTIDEALKSMKERFSTGLGTNEGVSLSMQGKHSSNGQKTIVESLKSMKEQFSTALGTNEGVSLSKQGEHLSNGQRTIDESLKFMRERFSTGLGTNEGVSMSKGEHSSNGQRTIDEALKSMKERLSTGLGTNEGVSLSKQGQHSRNGQRTIDEALKSMKERFSIVLWTNGALRSKREMLSTGRGTKKRTLHSKRKLSRRVNMTNEGAQKSKRELCTTGCTNVKITRQGRVRDTTRTTRAPRRNQPRKPRLRYRKQGSDDNFGETTEVPVRTTTRKKIGDKERIPVFMFMIKMLDFLMRLVT